MAGFTEYTAYLLYQTDKGKTYYLGNPQGIVNKPLQHVLANFSKGLDNILIEKLYERLGLFSKISPPGREKDIYFLHRIDPKYGLLFFVWVGNDQPRVKLLSYRKTQPTEIGIVKSPAWRYQLSFDVLLLLNKADLLIKTINHFLKHCDEKEFEGTFVDGMLPRCTMFHDDVRVEPHCFLYFRDIQSSNFTEPYTSTFRNCPKGYITCEVNAIFTCYFYYLCKKGIKRGGNVCSKDVIKVD